ncbi:E3 ubiquitin-protein ligase XIAP-like [Mizuhopecten yessoensis]|uniref:E3 ubiquitin-protein ligase XIAP-like n=1 Tax=Mizuhopecten yessoensis TaxID=6573 RepID=UPI000B45CF00|nr:E3 ubiquitin-protein ligase XIAP-like [Mizuhopecten yessoensis]
MTQSSFTLLDGSAFSETDFSHKLARVNSFRKFPDEYYTIFLTKLVNTGFYYTLRGDLVQCFSCGIELHVTELTDLDNVGLIHKEQSPGCVFISDFVKNQNYSILGITSGAEFPNYLFGNNRVKSLLRHGIDQSLAMDLARNGFFSEGTKSKVRCFHCGKEVHLHKNHLRMNKEHAEKSPNCTFLRKKQESSSTE